jgi:transposase
VRGDWNEIMVAKTYNESFKKNVVEKLLMPGSSGLVATARKFDLPPSTLFCWRKKYANFSVMKKTKTVNDWTPAQKLDAVMKTYSMNEEELGEFLRSNGLHSSDLEVMKNECLPSSNSKGRPRLDPEVVELRKQNKNLSKDLKRKDAALSEYAARVILLKKSHEIWGTKEDDE